MQTVSPLRGPCNPSTYKLLVAAISLAALSAAPATEPAATRAETCAGCAAKPTAKPDACCAARTTGGNREAKIENFSKDSLYQSDVQFTTDAGQAFSLGELRGRPVVLDMFFASCGYACPLTVTDMLALQGRLPAALRRKAVFVLVSFDVARDTPAALAHYRADRGLDGQWILLHGSDDSVRELAALLGIKYKQEADGAFSHSNLLTVLNPAGEIVHQRTGLRGGLDETVAALAASAGK